MPGALLRLFGVSVYKVGTASPVISICQTMLEFSVGRHENSIGLRLVERPMLIRGDISLKDYAVSTAAFNRAPPIVLATSLMASICQSARFPFDADISCWRVCDRRIRHLVHSFFPLPAVSGCSVYVNVDFFFPPVPPFFLFYKAIGGPIAARMTC